MAHYSPRLNLTIEGMLIVSIILSFSSISTLSFSCRCTSPSSPTVYHHRQVFALPRKNSLHFPKQLVSSSHMAMSMEYKAWLPVGSASALGGDEPIKVKIAGENYVVWKAGKNDDGWSVLADACPHRLAPLSEGRVDKATGCLECPYHGWQFKVDGKCSRIPQLDQASNTDEDRLVEVNAVAFGGPKIPVRANANSFPVQLTGDMIWAYLPISSSERSSQPSEDELFFLGRRPDKLFPILNDCTSFTARDLPYSFDFLIENFMDPAHIPFAHHSLQGVREDGSPIPMTRLTSLDNITHCEVLYNDVIRGKPREGIVSFSPPCYYHFRVRDPASSQFRMALLILAVPVSPGRSRAFISLAPGRKFPIPFPKWLLHTFTNRFLDTDIWVHDQERTALRNKRKYDRKSDSVLSGYVLPSSSDEGCKAWRRWSDRNMEGSPIYGAYLSSSSLESGYTDGDLPLMSKEEQVDRYESHARHCLSCRGALKNAETVKRFAPLAALLPMALSSSPWMRLFGIIIYLMTDQASRKVIRAINGPERGEKTSAAQLF